MNITEIQKATQDVLAPFHFSSLEDAALTFLHLSSLGKLSEYWPDVSTFPLFVPCICLTLSDVCDGFFSLARMSMKSINLVVKPVC